MNRLSAELQRLYLCGSFPTDGSAPALLDAQGQVRALVVELAQSVAWARIASFWHQVQEDEGLPPLALAVSGGDGYQLWFSLAVPVPLAQALTVLQHLRQRYWADLAPTQLRTWPTAAQQHTRLVPAMQGDTGYWSAFIVPGLGSMFADEPWLEREPSPDAQADLLQALQSITPPVWQQLLQSCQAAPAAISTATAPVAAVIALSGVTGATGLDPYQFLHRVMNDAAVPLPLRIDVAKALLPYSASRGPYHRGPETSIPGEISH